MTRSIKTILAICLLSITSSSVYAQTTKVVVIPMAGDDIAGVGKTGQMLCYDPSGNTTDILDCAGTADQDGKTQIGTAWPNPRFTDNSDGTVTDNLTDLIWLENANCITFHAFDNYSNNARSWAAALSSASNLAYGVCGLNDSSSAGDWRLPNYKELQSLININFDGPALSNDAGTGQWTSGSDSAFTGVQTGYYWSSSSYVGNPKFAWIVNLHHGDVDTGGKAGSYYVWPVRAGQ